MNDEHTVGLIAVKTLKSSQILDHYLVKESFGTNYIGALRAFRNILLRESDWTQFTDSPLTDSKKTEWKTYRQQLRDLPLNTSDPAFPTWPTKPS